MKYGLCVFFGDFLPPKQLSCAIRIPARFWLTLYAETFRYTKRPAFGYKVAQENSWEKKVRDSKRLRYLHPRSGCMTPLAGRIFQSNPGAWAGMVFSERKKSEGGSVVQLATSGQANGTLKGCSQERGHSKSNDSRKSCNRDLFLALRLFFL